MKNIVTLFSCLFVIVNLSFSQTDVSKPIVIKANYFDVSPPLRDMIQQNSTKVDMSWKEIVVRNPSNVFTQNSDKPDQYFNDPVRQSTFGQVLSDTTIQNFEGVGFNGGLPPDTDGDVSPNYYFQVVNTRYKIFNKTGTGVYGPFNNSAIFTGLPNNGNDGDAIVLYDENADRWLFSQFSLNNYPNGPFYENVAISQTNDPTGSWYRYQFTFTDMPDYPKLSVWQDAYYMTIRRFASGSITWKGPAAVAMDRAKMLTGDASATMVMFTLPSSSEGPLSLDCDSEFPPAGTPNYVSYLVQTPPTLNMYEFHVDFTNASNSTFNLITTIPISSFYTAGKYVIPQKGTNQKVDAFSTKGLMFRMPFRKFNDHWSALASFTVNVSSRAAIRWMELRNTGSGWSLYQEGTYAPDNTNYRWMPSIAMDSASNIALGFSISSSQMYPSIRYTGRQKNDALGTMTIAEKGIINGGGSQTDASGRWGDYSAMVVDPSAPGTFWYTNEYYSSTSSASWQTRIASFSIGNAFASYATSYPSNVCSGDSTQLNCVAYGGSGSYTYSWSSIPAGFNSNLQNPKATPAEQTKYIVAVSDGVKTNHDTTEVKVTIPPTCFAGNDLFITTPVPPSINIQGTASNYRAFGWDSNGDGYFTNSQTLTPTYFFGTTDTLYGNTIDIKLVALPISPCFGNVSSTMQVFFFGVGMKESGIDHLRVFPNPANDYLNITFNLNQMQSVKLEFVSIKGDIVFTESTNSFKGMFEKRLDLKSFNKGVYTLRITTDKGTSTSKVVVN